MPLGRCIRHVRLGAVACSVWVARQELPIHFHHINSNTPPVRSSFVMLCNVIP